MTARFSVLIQPTQQNGRILRRTVDDQQMLDKVIAEIKACKGYKLFAVYDRKTHTILLPSAHDSPDIAEVLGFTTAMIGENDFPDELLTFFENIRIGILPELGRE